MNRKQIKRIKGQLRMIASQIHRDAILKKEENRIWVKGKDKKGNIRELLHHPCAECGNNFRPKDVEIDHIVEVGELQVEGDLRNTSYGDCRVTNWQEWMDRCFCPLDNFQVLCVECHQKKTLSFNKDKRFGGHLL